MFRCLQENVNIPERTDYLSKNFYGHGRKKLTEDMVCFQQAASAFLVYYKNNNMHTDWKKKQLMEDGDSDLAKLENRL